MVAWCSAKKPQEQIYLYIYVYGLEYRMIGFRIRRFTPGEVVVLYIYIYVCVCVCVCVCVRVCFCKGKGKVVPVLSFN
jgi:hypothetical protein